MTEYLDPLITYFAQEPLELLFDAVDVLLVAFLIYRVLLLLRGTRAMQMGVGLLLVFTIYYVARRFGLLTLYSLLDGLLASVVLIVVVIFQHDIRRALMRAGGRSLWWSGGPAHERNTVEEVVRAATSLAQKRIGALIVFERDAMLDEFVQRGTVLDAKISQELLYGTFIPSFENPLHDGAVIVRDGRLWQAGVFLPLSTSSALDRALGTRHRAALGISEETDAVVVVVSEERGNIGLCFNGNMVRDVDPENLREALPGLLSHRSRPKKQKRKEGRPNTGRTSVVAARASLPSDPPERPSEPELPSEPERPSEPEEAQEAAPEASSEAKE